MPARLDALRQGGLLAIALACAGCEPVRAPPPTLIFGGLPVSGSMADARRAGFGGCFNVDAIHVRCRRHAMIVDGRGPYEAAIDLLGADGEGGFDQVTVWHDGDNYAVYAIADALERRGWRYCYTGDDRWGDQAIYTRADVPVRVSMDLSYWGKRRIRFLPEWNRRERHCIPVFPRRKAGALPG